MSQYSDMITSYLNDMLAQGRAERCPGISETVAEHACTAAVEQIVPSWTPFRDRAVRTAHDLCTHEVQPYVQCQCLNSNISLSSGCSL